MTRSHTEVGHLPIRSLPRGGLWLQTPIGALQLGCPPETLKDTLAIKDGIPRIVVLPRQLVDVERGIAVADLEFPIYWNLFVKKRPLIVVGEPELAPRILAAVQEALLGPVEQQLGDDVVAGRMPPDLQAEQRWFRRGESYSNGLLSLDDAVDFRAVDDRGQVQLQEGDVSVTIRLSEQEAVIAVTGPSMGDGAIDPRFGVAVLPREPPPTLPLLEGLGQPDDDAPAFQPPRFGVTVLGRSHGFDPDPKERTTGFVLWIAGHGVLVDPPVHSTTILQHEDIDAGLVDDVILTHVHGDHDAGLLQKAMTTGRVRLWTTPSIYASWLRKWTALTGIPIDELQHLFEFRPVRVGTPIDVHGAKLIFRFTLHSIPALAFEAHYQGKSFNYSGDTLNEPETVLAMHEQGFLDDARFEELNHFDWSHDLIFHESGIPPLHTPLSRLDSLDDEVKKRLRVLHVTPGRLVGHDDLSIAEPGRAHTIELPVESPPELRLLRHLRLLGRTPLFADLSMSAAADLLAAGEELHLKAGEQLIQKGTQGDVLYIVTGGKASVRRDGQELKVYALGDYIGETAVFLRRKRNADVYAITDLELLAIDGDAARRACAGTSVTRQVRRHARVRDLDCWALLDETTLFRDLTVKQKNAVERILAPTTLAAGQVVVAAGARTRSVWLLRDGAVVDDSGALHGRGALVGDPVALLAHSAQPRTLTVTERASAFRLEVRDLERLLKRNPGLRVRVQPWTAGQVPSTAQGMEKMVLEHLLATTTAG